MQYRQLASVLLASVLSFSANAGVIFSDDFESEGINTTIDKNYTDFDKWTVEEGSVDVYNNGHEGVQCAGNTGKCVDLDGSSRNAATFTTKDPITLNAGLYTLRFDIAGNQRVESDDSMLVKFSGFLSDETFVLGKNDAWTTIIRSFTLEETTSSYLAFEHAGGDFYGIMLDNVSLVPEPGTLALLGLGLAALGAARRKKMA